MRTLQLLNLCRRNNHQLLCLLLQCEEVLCWDSTAHEAIASKRSIELEQGSTDAGSVTGNCIALSDFRRT
jgi:hypothetical protein